MGGVSKDSAEDESEAQSKRYAGRVLRLSAADEGEIVGVGHAVSSFGFAL